MTDSTALAGSPEFEQRNTAAAALVRTLHKEGTIGTGTAGILLITLGAAKHLAAHASEADRNYIDDEPDTWTDETGKGWHWAGGMSGHGQDQQPLLAGDDWSDEDVPLSYVRAAVGLRVSRAATETTRRPDERRTCPPRRSDRPRRRTRSGEAHGFWRNPGRGPELPG